MLIRVEQGKGKKDRYTLLSCEVLEMLREYYRRYRPVEWLFYGFKKNHPLGGSTIQVAFRNAKKKPVSIKMQVSTRCAIALQPTY